MKCRRAQDWISLEIDDQLEPDRVPDLQNHLERCADCREYRHQLGVGKRLLQATSTGPSEGFEWRLQLRLNQALKRAAAETSYPLPLQRRGGWRRWWGHFGVAGSVGLAAVLAIAVFVQPGVEMGEMPGGGDDGLGARLPIATADLGSADDGNRRPYTRTQIGGRGLGSLTASGGRTVSTTRSGQSGFGAWQPFLESDLLRVQQLERENFSLKRRVILAEERARRLQAQLDSLTPPPVNQD